ncbi:MAG: hypothetical protein ACI9FR_000366 [Cryomorphaceae bacterium]|jgi:hypothetical protein
MSFKSKAASTAQAAFFCVLLSPSLSSMASNDTAQSRVYYALADRTKAPQLEGVGEFDCTDKIYTVLELENFAVGKHQFSVRWIDPAGQLREHTQYPFNVQNSTEHRLWAWLLLSRARGAGMLTFVNPAAGLEEFIGEWKIEVRVDDKLLDSGKFDVIC